MQLRVVVKTAGPVPAEGVPVHVEVRDTSMADAPASVVASTTERVGEGSPPTAVQREGGGAAQLAELTLELPDDGAPRDWTVWAHVQPTDATGLSAGDWITVQSYPVTSASDRVSETGESVPCVEVEVVQI